jgi:lipoyl(octanoyl) transferase
MSRGEIRVRIPEGLVPYDAAREMQLDAVAARRAGEAPDTLFLLEHPPVITLGRNADLAGVVATAEELARSGIDVRRSERGGQTTYHGPGQIVGYPIVDLRALRLGVAEYVRGLEETMMRAANALGVGAGRRDGIVGVFADGGRGPKIGAIGVHVSRGIAFHGFAFNVAPDLDHYRFIVPCGLSAIGVASLASILGAAPSMAAAREALIAAFAGVFDLEPIADDPR